MVHKLIVAFSVGLQLARTHAHALGWVCFSILIFAAMTPIGTLVGALVQTVSLDALFRDWLILVMQGVAVGTFLYVTFFEVSLLWLIYTFEMLAYSTFFYNFYKGLIK